MIGNSLSDSDLVDLASHVKSHALLISTNAQQVESKVKDVNLCKTSNRSELAATFLQKVVPNSLMAQMKLPNVVHSAKACKRNLLTTARALCGRESYFNCQRSTEEFRHCRRLINASSSCERLRVDEDVLSFIAASDECQRSNNAASEKRFVGRAPLLAGEVPFERPSKKVVPLHRRELAEKSVPSFDETEHVGTRELIKIAREDDHSQLVLMKDDDLKEEEKRELRCFHPSFLNAEDWSDDVADDALKIIC